MFPILSETIETHIEDYGVGIFIVGGYGEFDRLAAAALIAAKQRHPEITLLRLLSYHPAEYPINTPKSFDNTYYPFGAEIIPRKFAIARANRYVVDHVDYLIAYVWHPASKARELMEYAKKREKKKLISVCNLADKVAAG